MFLIGGTLRLLRRSCGLGSGTVHDSYACNVLERPCDSQEGASMLLRREGRFSGREGGFLRRGGGFLKKRGRVLKKVCLVR